jgi:hypothetical protein
MTIYTITLTLDNLASGFIGAILGVLASFAIYFHANWRSARNQLRAKLIDMKSVEAAYVGNGIDYIARYKATFKEMWNLVLTYRNTLPCFFRGRIDRAWVEYTGNKKGHFPDSFIAPSQEEAVHQRVDLLLQAINYKK